MTKKNKGNLLEQHAEKIVLGVSVLVSLALLWFFVIGSPNAATIGGRKFGPGEVDRQVRTQAEHLQAKLNEPPVPADYLPVFKEAYLAKLESPLAPVGDFKLMAPSQTETVNNEKREYTVPPVPPAQDAFAEAIRGAAHVPLDAVTPENPYDKTPVTVQDIDLITVQASFDVAALYRNFKQSFVMGRNVRAEWRDEVLAAPVFASAQLQRRRLLEDGRWSDWEVVPRPKIDQYRARLDIPEKVEALKYDISMQMAQLKPFDIQQTLLQPRPYDFASADTVWLTPSFYEEYVKILDREQKEALRLERERSLNTRGNTRGRTDATGYDAGGRGVRGGAETGYGDARSTRTPTARSRQTPTRGRLNDPASMRGRETGQDALYDEYGQPYALDDPRRRQQRTADDVVADNSKIIIDERTPLEEMREPLIFWAHDDTVEPDNTYDYRIRLGVFNPIAGKNWCLPQDEDYNDQVILWSEFAQAPEPVVVPPMVYFFPTELARATEGGVLIEVAKYHMGNWQKEQFEVRPGEMIGKAVELQSKTGVTGRGEGYDEYGMSATPVLPEKIDFGTGAMLVDLVKSDVWTGVRMTRSELIDALYTRDGLTMQHVPVRKNSWTDDMKVQYGRVEEAVAKPVQISTSRSKSKIDVFRPTSPYPGNRRGYGEFDRTGDRYMDPGLDRRM